MRKFIWMAILASVMFGCATVPVAAPEQVPPSYVGESQIIPPTFEGDAINLGPYQCVTYELGDYVQGATLHIYIGNMGAEPTIVPDDIMSQIIEMAMQRAMHRFGHEWPEGVKYIYEGLQAEVDVQKLIVIVCFVMDEIEGEGI